MIIFLKPREGHVNLHCIDQVFLTTLIQWGFKYFLLLFYVLSAIEKNSEVSTIDLKGSKAITDLIGIKYQIKSIAVFAAY